MGWSCRICEWRQRMSVRLEGKDDKDTDADAMQRRQVGHRNVNSSSQGANTYNTCSTHHTQTHILPFSPIYPTPLLK
jgi:hypothetical protein